MKEVIKISGELFWVRSERFEDSLSSFSGVMDTITDLMVGGQWCVNEVLPGGIVLAVVHNSALMTFVADNNDSPEGMFMTEFAAELLVSQSNFPSVPGDMRRHALTRVFERVLGFNSGGEDFRDVLAAVILAVEQEVPVQRVFSSASYH